MTTPQQFFDEFEPLRERIDWARAGLGTDKKIAQAKMIIEDFREFFRKWHPLVHDPTVSGQLEIMRGQMDTMERHLIQIYWAHLIEVIEARKEWLQAELIFKGVVAITILRKEMPEHLRDEFEKALRGPENVEFDSEKEFRGAEKRAAESEIKYRQSLAGLEVDWPGRVDTALRERLEKLDMNGVKEWEDEIAMESAKLMK